MQTETLTNSPLGFLDKNFTIELTENERQQLESGSFFESDSDSDAELEEVGNSNNQRGFSSTIAGELQEQNISGLYDVGNSLSNVGKDNEFINNIDSHKRKAEEEPSGAPPKQRVRTENYAASEQRATYDTQSWRERVQQTDDQERMNVAGHLRYSWQEKRQSEYEEIAFSPSSFLI